ncbi:unnamed protein product [Polarella glacialis]|uniref:Glycosyl transferase 64 domain-containing protein n=1 Tax=Polarella glacialis TaxID=89957 RepID=A0A813DGW6_POLGL|nr:unnamed protein product [Polarella glacialis]
MTLTQAVLVASSCAAGDCGAPRNSALLQIHRQEKTIIVPPAELQAVPGIDGQFLYGAFRIGTAGTKQESAAGGLETAEHVYRMKDDTFTVQSIEPHVVRKKGGKEYEIWSTSSPILSSIITQNANNSQKITFVPVSVMAQRVLLAPNTPEVYVSVFYISELDKHYYYTFEVQPPFRVLGMGPQPFLPALLAQDPVAIIPGALGLLAEGAHEGQRLAARADFLPSPPEWPRGVTLIVMAHKRDRLDGLLATVNRYCQSSPELLHEVVMIWNNQTDLGAVEIMRQNTSGGGVPVRVLETDANSMNNRFAVWGALQTEGVVVQDDDMWISSESLQLLVDEWRQQPDRLYGAANERVDVQSRDAADKLEDGKSWENNLYQWKEVNPKCYSQDSSNIPSDIQFSDIPSDIPNCVFDTQDYSILLPHPWVLSRRYLKEYMQHPEGTQLVDDMMNCDDIYLNSVVSNATQAPPIALNIPVHRFPEWANGDAMWVSQGDKWLEKRSRCLEKINFMYDGQDMSEDTGTVWRRSSPLKDHVAAHASRWACQGSVLLLLVLGFTGRWLLKLSQPSGAAKNRVAVFDNARFLMSVLIIFTHLKEQVLLWELDPGRWLEGDNSSWYMSLFNPVSPFLTLTGFVVISGYVSQGAPSPARWRSFLVTIFLPCLMYSGVLAPQLAYFIKGEYPTQQTLMRVINASPEVEWYLQSLVTWRLLAFAVHGLAAKAGSPLWPWWLGICWAAAVSATVWGAPLFWSTTSMVYFLPAFAVGQLFPLADLLQAVEPCLSVRCFGAAVLAVWVWATAVLPGLSLHSNSFPTLDAFQHKTIFKDMPVLGPGPVEAWDVFLTPFLAIFSALLYSAVAITLIATIIPRATTCFTKAGGQGSLYIYLFHPFVIQLQSLFWVHLPPVITAALPMSYHVQSSVGHLAVYMLQLALCVLVAATLSSDPFIALLKPFMRPEWLVDLALGPLPAKTPPTSEGGISSK